MGTITQGILGGFSGKVGTVIGASWKGISYMRGQAQHVKNPRTAAQTYNRAALQLITDTLRPIIPTLRMTFAKSAGKMSEFNKAVQINYKESIVNQDGTPVVDYSKLVLSKGSIKPFDQLIINDMSQDGNYYMYPKNNDNSSVRYEGLIYFIYDVENKSWYTKIYEYSFRTGSMLDSYGIVLHANQSYLGFACAYDPSTGQVSNPVTEVQVYGAYH